MGNALGGAAGGVFGAIITESNVLEGAGRGLIIALVNDAMHSAFNGGGQDPDPPTNDPITRALREALEFSFAVAKGPVAVYLGAGGTFISVSSDIGGYYILQGPLKGTYVPAYMISGAFNTKLINASVDLQFVFYTGPINELTIEDFYGSPSKSNPYGGFQEVSIAWAPPVLKNLGNVGLSIGLSITKSGYELYSLGLTGDVQIPTSWRELIPKLPGPEIQYKQGGVLTPQQLYEARNPLRP